MAVDMKYQKIIKYLVKATCAQPLHIGSASGDKEEVLVHPADDRPFIQASSLSGVLRQYCEKLHGQEQAGSLFGARRLEEGENSSDKASKVRFSDGIFSDEGLILELRPRLKINQETGTCDDSMIKGTDMRSGHKFNMEYIGAGAEFEFSVYLFDESWQKELEETLAAVHQEGVQLGGQKSNGCGFLNLKSLNRKIFDLSQREERRKWADEDILPENEYEDILSHIKTPQRTVMAYEVMVEGSTEGELLVKSIAVQDYGKDAPDSMNIRDAAKQYIVPGSSLKGALRSQMEKIASYIDSPRIIDETFGTAGNSQNGGRAGNIVFYDTVVGNREDNDLARARNRIHIDKFTGGVMHGALFNEKNVSGAVHFRIVIYDRNTPDSTCGLLLMALRDMAIGMMSIGGGFHVGKGIIDVDRIVVCDCINKNEAVIGLKTGKITDEYGIVARCMKAVQPEKEAV